ncbi:MAG TPA: LysM peptidoglycan-binding domain-containing protein [Actinomycetota bacterium]|nr:LysM peptidoglycan-binding domain-containing protein [Actinomycetota bacterium]
MTRTRVRWDRVVAFVLVLMGLLWVGARAAGSSESGTGAVYRVRAGDTLWAIATERLGPAADPRPLVEDIRDLNGLTRSALAPGQLLRLPAA